MLEQSLLDTLWNFGEPEQSERRFELELDGGEYDESERAELRTQLARALGLQSRFAEAEAMLEVVAVRRLLERGRVLNSAGTPEHAAPLFEYAATRAGASGLVFLQIDALHMLALADPERTVSWTEQAVLVAMTSADDRTRRWLVALNNNLGWHWFDAGRGEEALEAFQDALMWAERVGTDAQQLAAREAVAECETHFGSA